MNVSSFSSISTASMRTMTGLQGSKGMGRPPSAADIISKMDQDGDGSLNSSEVKGPLAEQFGKADSDSNGLLSGDELQKAMEQFHQEMRSHSGMGQPPSTADLISQMDQNGNGTIDSDEAQGVLADRFSKADSDGDGQVSEEELNNDINTFKQEMAARGATAGMPGVSSAVDDLISMMDQDGDGTINSEEAKSSLLSLFDQERDSDSNDLSQSLLAAIQGKLAKYQSSATVSSLVDHTV